MWLDEMRALYEREGYPRLNATARVCQDVILTKLAASTRLSGGCPGFCVVSVTTHKSAPGSSA